MDDFSATISRSYKVLDYDRKVDFIAYSCTDVIR